MKPSIQNKIKRIYPKLKKLIENNELDGCKIKINDHFCKFGCVNKELHLFDYTGLAIINGKEVRKYLLKNIKSEEEILQLEKIIIQNL
jgi:hypothetical protein